MLLDVWLSRFAQGSSASRMLGLFTSARAIATRCCSPPESSLCRWSTRSPRPTRSRISVLLLRYSSFGTPRTSDVR